MAALLLSALSAGRQRIKLLWHGPDRVSTEASVREWVELILNA